MPRKDAAKPKSQQNKVQELLATADDILQETGEAYIFKLQEVRPTPTFERSELKFGELLGVGGFCLVREVKKIDLKRAEEAPDAGELTEPSRADAPEEVHYDVITARRRMSKYCLRHGDARYAVKQLRTDLSELETARGMIDLAIEAKFLSVISHPNIVRMRATASCGPMNKAYFLVLDRLYGTLEDKIEEWKEEKKSNKKFLGLKRDKAADGELDLSRLVVAYDIASAFRYIHDNKLVYRDIKAENIGFDVRGDVKVFDFGLAKSLHPKLRSGDGMFKLTPRTGSFPYMAPEVAQGKPYNTLADVYSFGMLMWEMFALKLPFEGYTRKEYYQKMSLGGARPSLSKSWPSQVSLVIKESWDETPKKRPDFGKIAMMLQSDMRALSGDKEIVDRSRHMRRKSRGSIYYRGSVRNGLSMDRRHESTRTLHASLEDDLGMKT